MANKEVVAPVSYWLGEDQGDWELVLPSTSDRVCYEYENHTFPMNEVVFKDMGFRFPFLDFQQ